MKKIILPLLLLVITLSSCNGGGDSSDSACGNVASFTVTQNNENITVNLNSTATPLYYEVSVNQTPQSNVNPNTGVIKTMNTTTQTFNINDLYMQPGSTYLFYVRTACTNGSKSKWSAPLTITPTTFCFIPYNLGFTSSGLYAAFKWETSDSSASYFQVEYGPEHFTQGAGTTVQVGGNQYSGMSMLANHTYDFYVRAYCNSSLGWSSWAGPYTYLSGTNQNACTLPLSLSTNVESISGNYAYVGLHWDYNGETNFEFAVVQHNSAISPSNIQSHSDSGTYPVVVLNRSYDYDFYIRAICSDGSRTAWTGPVVIYL